MHTTVVIGALAFAACTEPIEESYGEITSAISVGTAVGGSCSTASVRGLALQIAREVDCTWPSSLAKFQQTSTIRFTSSAVIPFLHGGAKQDLAAAAAQRTLRVNSGYRLLPQQYLLYRWWRAGRCGIAAAALPGRSNHEGARAVDLANWSTRVGVMGNHHWSHSVPGDPVHFDHFGSPDHRGKDVRAFQRLWNRNHPGDKIAVDGDYGPQTAARLRKAPAKGFKKGPLCSLAIEAPGTVPELDVLAVVGPDLAPASQRVHYTVSVANPTAVPWPATARIIAAPTPLYDAATWTSPTEIGPLGVDVPAGGDVDLDFELATPATLEDTPFTLDLAVVLPAADGSGATLGTFELALTVTAGGGDTSSEDGADEDDGTPADEDGVVDDAGGCSTGRDSSWIVLAIVIGASLRRKRRFWRSGR